MADNLEKYFKKHLSDETPSEEKWNVPSDDVWEKALPMIRKKKGLFIPLRNLYIIIALLLIGLTVSLGIIFYPNFTVDDQYSDSRQGIDTKPKESTSVSAGVADNELQKPAVEEKIKEEVMVLEDKIDDSNTAGKPGNETNAGSSGPADSEKPAAMGEMSNNEAQSEIVTIHEPGPEIEALPYTLNQKKTASVLIPERKRTLILNKRASIAPEYSFKKERSFIPRKNSFAIGIYYAPTYNNTAVRGEISNGKLETGNHYLYSGNYGLTIKYYFSDRFSLISGLGSLKIKSWSEATTDFSYDGTNEHIMPGGEKENMSGIPMATPFGEIGTEITYRFPESENIPDGETMEAILETHQDISYFSVPLGIEYDLLPVNKRLQWYAEGGVHFNWASGDATEFNSRILHYGTDMNVVNEVMTNHPEFTDFYLDFYIGSGLSYSITKYLMLQGSLRYSRNVTKVNVQDDVYTNVQAAGLKISLIYFF